MLEVVFGMFIKSKTTLPTNPTALATEKNVATLPLPVLGITPFDLKSERQQ